MMNKLIIVIIGFVFLSCKNEHYIYTGDNDFKIKKNCIIINDTIVLNHKRKKIGEGKIRDNFIFKNDNLIRKNKEYDSTKIHKFISDFLYVYKSNKSYKFYETDKLYREFPLFQIYKKNKLLYDSIIRYSIASEKFIYVLKSNNDNYDLINYKGEIILDSLKYVLVPYYFKTKKTSLFIASKKNTDHYSVWNDKGQVIKDTINIKSFLGTNNKQLLVKKNTNEYSILNKKLEELFTTKHLIFPTFSKYFVLRNKEEYWLINKKGEKIKKINVKKYIDFYPYFQFINENDELEIQSYSKNTSICFNKKSNLYFAPPYIINVENKSITIINFPTLKNLTRF